MQLQLCDNGDFQLLVPSSPICQNEGHRSDCGVNGWICTSHTLHRPGLETRYESSLVFWQPYQYDQSSLQLSCLVSLSPSHFVLINWSLSQRFDVLSLNICYSAVEVGGPAMRKLYEPLYIYSGQIRVPYVFASSVQSESSLQTLESFQKIFRIGLKWRLKEEIDMNRG